MELDLTDAVVAITGAGSGIGAECSRAFAAEGARLGLIDRNSPALAAVAGELNDSGMPRTDRSRDVTDESQLAAALATLTDRLGDIRVAVGCAGVSGPFGADVADIALADWERVLGVNVTGQFLFVKHALPSLRRSADRHEAVAIVLMASDSSFVAAPGMVPYNASKGAVLQLTRALSVDLAR